MKRYSLPGRALISGGNVRRIDAQRGGHANRPELRVNARMGNQPRIGLVGAPALVYADGRIGIPVVPEPEGDGVSRFMELVVRSDVAGDDRQVLPHQRRRVNRVETHHFEAGQAIGRTLGDLERDIHGTRHPLDDGVHLDVGIPAALEHHLQAIHVGDELALIEVALVAETDPSQQRRTGEQARLGGGDRRGEDQRIDAMIAAKADMAHHQRLELAVRRPGRERHQGDTQAGPKPPGTEPPKSCD